MNPNTQHFVRPGRLVGSEIARDLNIVNDLCFLLAQRFFRVKHHVQPKHPVGYPNITYGQNALLAQICLNIQRVLAWLGKNLLFSQYCVHPEHNIGSEIQRVPIIVYDQQILLAQSFFDIQA